MSTNLSTTGVCPNCSGRGLLITRNGREVTAKQCSCVEQRKIQNILKNSRITAEFQKLQFSNFNTHDKHLLVAEALQVARNYVKNFNANRHNRCNSLALLGQPGVGKTHLICAIANNLMSLGIKVLYYPHREGFSELKDAIAKNGPYGEKICLMKEIDVLVWDDLYKGRLDPTNFELDTMFEVINYRYLNHLPMVISSEKLSKELLGIDQAIGSRILEMAKGYIVEFDANPTLNHRLIS